MRESDGREVDTLLKNNIEGIILKWAYQIDEVLSKDSAEELNKGNNPGPMTEIEFWEAKCMNLESLYEQMKANTTKKMASILNVTDSAYYPAFKYKIQSDIFEEIRNCLSSGRCFEMCWPH